MTGSLQGMRYMLKKAAGEAGDILLVTIWPGPCGYAKTVEELKQRKEFPFTADGVQEAGAWLNEQYEVQKPLWDTVKLE